MLQPDDMIVLRRTTMGIIGSTQIDVLAGSVCVVIRRHRLWLHEGNRLRDFSFDLLLPTGNIANFYLDAFSFDLLSQR